MTLRLRIREIAESKGLNLSQLARRADVGVTTVRRMWFSTADGKEHGEPLQYISLDALERIAAVLEVDPCSLLTRTSS
jgi:transcriptional regulator with XRE-family HTH domain